MLARQHAESGQGVRNPGTPQCLPIGCHIDADQRLTVRGLDLVGDRRYRQVGADMEPLESEPLRAWDVMKSVACALIVLPVISMEKAITGRWVKNDVVAAG